jgi:hypothetical protein
MAFASTTATSKRCGWICFKRTDLKFGGDELTGPLDESGKPLKGTLIDLD